MTDKDFEQPQGDDEATSGEQGSETNVSDPASQDDELTVDDILNAASGDEVPTEGAAGEDPHLADLKRITAEYANYRRRTEENRVIEKQRATGDVIKGLLPVLDDLDRAEKHGDLVDGSAFLVLADKLRGLVGRFGVEPYGAAGDVFDPQQHEAIFQQPTPGVTEPQVLEVVEVGYRLGDVELRPAKVVVAVPAD